VREEKEKEKGERKPGFDEQCFARGSRSLPKRAHVKFLA
jgi:hypothetical protein